jgi:hypothetical protein
VGARLGKADAARHLIEADQGGRGTPDADSVPGTDAAGHARRPGRGQTRRSRQTAAEVALEPWTVAILGSDAIREHRAALNKSYGAGNALVICALTSPTSATVSVPVALTS